MDGDGSRDFSPDQEKIPRHIAIIMDGNGRWAERRNKPRVFGHRAGVEAVRSVVEEFRKGAEDYSDDEIESIVDEAVNAVRKAG